MAFHKMRVEECSTLAFSSADIGSEMVIADGTRGPTKFSRSAVVSAPSADRRFRSLRNAWKSISQTRGTKFKLVGRTNARSSNNVDCPDQKPALTAAAGQNR